MAIVKLRWLCCNECGEWFMDRNFASAKGAREEAWNYGWVTSGKRDYCEPCGKRVGWRCCKCNSWYRNPVPADAVCPDCAKTIALATKPPTPPVVPLAPARLVRDDDGRLWEVAFAELPWRLMDDATGSPIASEEAE